MPNPNNFLQYGGILMDLVKMHTWSRKAVYNGNQYLYTRHILAVTCVLNPGVNPVLQQLAFAPNPFNQAIAALAGVLVPQGAIVAPANPVINAGGANAKNQAGGVKFPPNPLANLPPFNVGVVPNPQLGMVTDSLIRHALMQPRQQLIYSIQGYAPLASPWTGYKCDATGGPLPLACDVHEIQSGKTWLINYIVQTDINECQKYTNKPKILLSHEWSMNHSIDQDCYTVRTIEGRAVFSRDRLEPNAVVNNGKAFQAALPVVGNLAIAGAINPPPPLNADEWRQQLFHPLPTNFKRERVEVKLNPDGVTLDYLILDRERALSINFPNVTRIQGLHTAKTSWGGAAVAVDAVVKGARNLFRGFEENVRIAEANPAFEVPIAGQAAAAAAIAGADFATFMRVSADLALDLAIGLIPQITHDISFRIWGNRNATRAELTQDALALLITRLAPIANAINVAAVAPAIIPNNKFVLNANDLQNMLKASLPDGLVPANLQRLIGAAEAGLAILAGFNAQITHDLAGKYVELHYSTLASPLSMFLLGPQTVNLLMGPDDTLVSNDKTSGISSTQWDGRQGYPTDDLSRGTYIEREVTQILLGPCQTPPAQSKSPPEDNNSNLKPSLKLPGR